MTDLAQLTERLAGHFSDDGSAVLCERDDLQQGVAVSIPRGAVCRTALVLGLTDLAKDPDECSQLGRLLGDGYDADRTTGDALLQCIIFGRTVFG